MTLQYSRGCPCDCEFCCITKLFGRKVRTKSREQIIQELDVIYNQGWKGPVFFVDDNFIGSKHKLKTEILPSVARWEEKKGHPFYFITQASINLADDEQLMKMMADAGFYAVFVGIETVDDDCLAETGKFHNRNRDLLASVRKIQRSGLEVQGGFIVGFDNDKPSIFNKIVQFIQESGITTAMVGLLNAVKGTRLYKRLEKEDRLIFDATGDNTDFSINFTPRMGKETLLRGYRRILENIYSPKQYSLRLLEFLKAYNPPRFSSNRSISIFPKIEQVKALVKSMFILGISDKGRAGYWKIFFWSAFRRPSLFPTAITLLIYGYHFRRVFKV